MKYPRLAVVLPCYNEADILEKSIDTIAKILTKLIESGKIAKNSYACYVDDGSYDNSWAILTALAKKSKYLSALKLSKNEGHQYALLAGLEYVSKHCDCAISTDADLQHEPETVIPSMIDKYLEGYEIVLGISSDRKKTNIFKRSTARLFYHFMNMLGVKTVPNHSDTRLMGLRALKALHQYKERQIYLRGIFTNMGFSVAHASYAYKKRIGGKTKYTLKKMLNLAFRGISSFSVAPLRFISTLGLVVSIASVAAGGWALYQHFIAESTIPGWTSIVLPIFFLAGIQLLAMGIIGEYLACVYIEIKQRPRYIIEETANAPTEE